MSKLLGHRKDRNKHLLSSDYTSDMRLAVPRTIKVGLSKVENQAKPLKYSEKKNVVFRTNLDQMFTRTATGLNLLKPTGFVMRQQV